MYFDGPANRTVEPVKSVIQILRCEDGGSLIQCISPAQKSWDSWGQDEIPMIHRREEVCQISKPRSSYAPLLMPL